MAYGQQQEYQDDPFTGPLLKALKIRQYIKDSQAQDEHRAFLREQMKMHLDEAQRHRTQEDFNTAMTLNRIGALPATPGDTGQNDAALSVAADITPEGARPIMKTPIGNYRMPSRMDQVKRATQEQQVASVGEYGKAYATASGKAAGEAAGGAPSMVEVDLPELGKQMVPRSQVVAAARLKQSAKSGESLIKSYNDAGDLTLSDKAGNTVSVAKGVGKTKTGKEALPSNADVEALMKEWRPNLYNARSITPALIAEANKVQTDPITGEVKSNPAAAQVDKVEKELRDAATKEVQARIRNKGIGQGAQTKGAAVTGAAPKTWSIKQSDVPKAAKLKGMSIEQFLKAAQENGGTILP